MGSRWAILKNNSKWKPISLSDCENHKGEWLYVPSVYGILNSPNPGLSHLLQQIALYGIWERDICTGKG